MWLLLLLVLQGSARLITTIDRSFLPASKGGVVRVSWLNTNKAVPPPHSFGVFPLSACRDGVCFLPPIALSPAHDIVVELTVKPHLLPGDYGIFALLSDLNADSNNIKYVGMPSRLVLGPDLSCPSIVSVSTRTKVSWSNENKPLTLSSGSQWLLLFVKDSLIVSWESACSEDASVECQAAGSHVLTVPAAPGAYHVRLVQTGVTANHVDDYVPLAECQVEVVAPSKLPSISAPLSVTAQSAVLVNWDDVDTTTTDTYVAFWKEGRSPFTVPSEPVALVETSWSYIYGKGTIAHGLAGATSAARAHPSASGTVPLEAPSVPGKYTVWLCYNNCASTPCEASTRCPASLDIDVTPVPALPEADATIITAGKTAPTKKSRKRGPSVIVGTGDINSVRASSYNVDQGAAIDISWSCYPADVSHKNDSIGMISILDNPQNASLKQTFQPSGENAGTISVTLDSSVLPGVYVLVYYYKSGANSNGAFVLSSPLIINKQGLSLSTSDTRSDNSVLVTWNAKVPHASTDCLKVCVFGEAQCPVTSPSLGPSSSGSWLAALPAHNNMYEMRYIPGCSGSPVAFSKPITAIYDYLTYTSTKFSSLPHSLAGSVDTGAGLMFALGNLGNHSLTRSTWDALVLRRASDPAPTTNPYSQSYGAQDGEVGWVYVDSPTTPTLAIPLSAGPGYYYAYYFSYGSQLPVARSALIQATPLSITCPARDNATTSSVKHMIIMITENHSFDSIFGRYCSSPPAAEFPACNVGTGCCEAAPKTVLKSGGTGTCLPNILDDTENQGYDRSHSRAAIKGAVNNGQMDEFVPMCSTHGQNFAVGSESTMKTYFEFAMNSTLIDNYWQSAAGASCQSDVFLARAGFVFYDNAQSPAYLINPRCYPQGPVRMEPTIAHLLMACGNSVAYYGEGLSHASEGCYPSYWDPTDSPFAYYHRMPPLINRDLSQLYADIKQGSLPAVSYVKGLGIHSEHGGISTFVESQQIWADLYRAVQHSAYSKDTVLISVPDEGGGFYDHVGNTPESIRWPDGLQGVRTFSRNGDSVSYGGRLPFLAVGEQVKANFISHAMTEHASIVKFQEFNWLGGEVGLLGTRDADPRICNLQSIFNDKAGIVPVESTACDSGRVM